MNETRDLDQKKARKPWTKPVLRRFKLTEEETEALRASDDPEALLAKMRPEIEARSRAGK